jgi:hypothetical protein
MVEALSTFYLLLVSNFVANKTKRIIFYGLNEACLALMQWLKFSAKEVCQAI